MDNEAIVRRLVEDYEMPEGLSRDAVSAYAARPNSTWEPWDEPDPLQHAGYVYSDPQYWGLQL